MNRHQNRVQIVFALYQHLLLKKEIAVCFSDNFEIEDDYIAAVRNDVETNIHSYITEISAYLKNWSFDRLSYIDQAILIESFAEVRSGLNNKNIVIDEAIRIAKEYSDEDSYKYINGVLDNL